MSFPRYPAYKPSGVEWLGEVPEHWSIKQLKHCIHRLGSGGTPESGNPEYWADNESDDSIPWVAIGDMSSASVVYSTAKSLTQAGIKEKNLEIFPAGSLLYSIYASLGKVSILGVDAAFNQAILAIISNPELVSQPFLKYWLESIEKHLSYYSSSNTQANLNAAKVLAYPVAVPHPDEQARIATFLDRETAKIDALIAEQQRLIELLQEKRQAVISHAVTKGLNPDAPMKDSGVEWLGEVPEHWVLKRLKHLSPSLTVGIVVNPSEYVSDDGLPFVYGGDIREGVIDWENSRRISPALSDKQPKTRLKTGDLLMVRVGAPGVTAVVPPQCEGGNCASVMLIRQGWFSSQWLCYMLNTRIVRFQVEVVQYGAAQEQFNISHAVNFWLPVPPRQEQDRIAAFLDAEHEKGQGLVNQAQSAVCLLQERRSALISAAVTGKIDLRGLVPEADAA